MLNVEGDQLRPGYLNTASLGVPPRAARRALTDAVSRWGAGCAMPHDYDSCVEDARATFARLVGVKSGTVAVGAQVSAFTGVVASSLRPGSEVVVYEDDFTSVLFPFLVAARRGVRVRAVGFNDLVHSIGPRTSLVALSAVQSADGTVAPLGSIAEAAAEHGAMTYIDATQACGWLPLAAGRFDFVACGAYKWLLAPRGTAFLAVRRRALETIEPVLAGWYAGAEPWSSIYGLPLRLAPSARRLDVSPAWLCWTAAAPALRYIERVGIERIHRHDVSLANRFRAGLGLPPSDSAIVAADTPNGAERLRRAGMSAASCAGRLRVSFHLYNTDADVDRALGALDLRAGGRRSRL